MHGRDSRRLNRDLLLPVPRLLSLALRRGSNVDNIPCPTFPVHLERRERFGGGSAAPRSTHSIPKSFLVSFPLTTTFTLHLSQNGSTRHVLPEWRSTESSRAVSLPSSVLQTLPRSLTDLPYTVGAFESSTSLLNSTWMLSRPSPVEVQSTSLSSSSYYLLHPSRH